MTPGDLEGVIALQARAFPKKMTPWTTRQLSRHLARFPEGQLVAVDPGGRIVGSASSLIVRWGEIDDAASWNAITGRGSFSPHTPQGDTLYGADLCVDPDAWGLGVGSALYAARRALVQHLRLPRMIAGGRIPGYKHLAAHMTPERYVQEVIQGLRHDRVLSFQIANGFVVRGIIPGYIRSDKDSHGYATLIEWVNPAYHDRSVPAA